MEKGKNEDMQVVLSFLPSGLKTLRCTTNSGNKPTPPVAAAIFQSLCRFFDKDARLLSGDPPFFDWTKIQEGQ